MLSRWQAPWVCQKVLLLERQALLPDTLKVWMQWGCVVVPVHCHNPQQVSSLWAGTGRWSVCCSRRSTRRHHRCTVFGVTFARCWIFVEGTGRIRQCTVLFPDFVEVDATSVDQLTCFPSGIDAWIMTSSSVERLPSRKKPRRDIDSLSKQSWMTLFLCLEPLMKLNRKSPSQRALCYWQASRHNCTCSVLQRQYMGANLFVSTFTVPLALFLYLQ